jgi:hypothetical protein
MTIDKFDLNSILVNINKLEPYRFVKDHTFQPTLSKLNNIIKIINWEQFEIYTINMAVDNPVEKRISY